MFCLLSALATSLLFPLGSLQTNLPSGKKVVVSVYLVAAQKASKATLTPCLDTIAIRLINDRWATGQAVSTQRVVGIVVALC